MFTKDTVLILGAGASCHLGYPTGDRLIEEIKSTINHGCLIYEDGQIRFTAYPLYSSSFL